MTRSIAVQNQSRRRKSRSTTTSSSRAPRPSTSTSRAAAVSVSVEVPMAIDGASESEYETDTDAEPEEFYISLDLTIPTPIHAGPSSNPHANAAPPSTLPTPLPLSSTTRSGRSGRRHLPNRPPDATDDDDPTTNGNTVARWATGDSGRLQILDLHTENPLISFANRIWSGSWMGTVGTELYIRCPEGPAPEDQEEVKGIYISQKDTSAAAAAVVGLMVAGEEGGGLGLGSTLVPDDPDVGKVIAVSNTRVHCLPAVVTAKERPLAGPTGMDERTYGWRPGKSTFLERLEAIQVARGERKPRGEGDGSSSDDSESDVQERGTAFQARVDGGDYDDYDDDDEYEEEYEFEEEMEEEMEQEVERQGKGKGKGKGKEKVKERGRAGNVGKDSSSKPK